MRTKEDRKVGGLIEIGGMKANPNYNQGLDFTSVLRFAGPFLGIYCVR